MFTILRLPLRHPIEEPQKILKLCRRGFLLSGVNRRIVKSSSENIVIPDVSIPELLLSKIGPYHKYTAVECPVTKKKYTFEQLRTKSGNLAKALKNKLKLRKGDAVVIVLENSPDYAVAALGIFSGGFVITTVNPLYTAAEIARQLPDSNPKAVITNTGSFAKVKDALDMSKLQIPVMTVKKTEGESLPAGAINFEEFISGTSDISDLNFGNSGDLAFLPYSSGTTGLPKGVQLTHRNLIANMMQITSPDFAHFTHPSDSHQDVAPMIFPMFHIFGFVVGLMTNILVGTKVITLPKFTPDLYISTLKNHQVTHVNVPPPLVLFFISHPEVKPEHFKFLRFMLYGGAPVSSTDEVRLHEKIQRNDFPSGQAYGLTETSPIMTYIRKNKRLTESNSGSAGSLVPNTLIKLISPDDPEGKPLGPNEQGEILVKGPQVTSGYYNRPDANKEAFLDDWFRTGDVGYYTEEEWLFVNDRIKELIKVKGFQVAPAELEALIRSHPQVEEVAVIGIPHDTHGEVPRAYVVPKESKLLNPDDVHEFVKKNVVKYKHLVGGVQVVDSIPKNPSGKILRRILRDQYREHGV